MRPLGLPLEEIDAVLPCIDLLTPIADGFVAYSRGQATIPAPGELSFEEPQGDVHIKYGYFEGDDVYVVKIASGFYRNPALGLPVGQGLMLAFGRTTGELRAVLLDGGLLTRIRTGVAGALAARYLAPPSVERIGVIGAGNQARWQVRMLAQVLPTREVVVFSEPQKGIDGYREEMEEEGFRVQAVGSAAEVAEGCELIVTTTPARDPVLPADAVRPGTHITGVGADTPGKRELESELFRRADRVVGDSRERCRVRGECAHAIGAGTLNPDDIVELGSVIAGDVPGCEEAEQITIADLAGVAVQDIAITRSVLVAAEQAAKS
jgi:ornithine cyclodeaminase